MQETIVEVSRKHSPTGQRYLHKPYPKSNEPRTFGVRQDWLDAVAEHIKPHGLGRDDLLFTTTAGTPISRNTGDPLHSARAAVTFLCDQR